MNETVTLPKLQTSSLSQQAYHLMRERIISKDLLPGQRLNLPQIGAQLGISQTPLKEALKRLEAEGLITIAPRSGTFVTDPTPAEIAASFEVRRVLEVYAVEQLATRFTTTMAQSLQTIITQIDCLIYKTTANRYLNYLDLDHCFHRQLVTLVDNPRLTAAHDRENIHAHMARIRYHSPLRTLTTPQAEHGQLLEALVERRSAQATSIIDAHLRRSCEWLLADMRQNTL